MVAKFTPDQEKELHAIINEYIVMWSTHVKKLAIWKAKLDGKKEADVEEIKWAIKVLSSDKIV